MKFKWVLTFIIILLFLIVLAIFVYFYRFSIKFELVEIVPNTVSLNSESFYWYSIRSEEYQPMYGGENLSDRGDFRTKFDTEKYTYLVLLGHQLLELKCSLSESETRNVIGFPNQLVGLVTLSKEKDNCVRIYRIKKMNLDSDIHEPERGVSFK